MVYGCSKLISLDLSSFRTPNLTSIASMFLGCTSLISLNLENFITPSLVESNAKYVFTNIQNLTICYKDNINEFIKTDIDKASKNCEDPCFTNS